MLADPRAAEDVATSIAKGVGKGKGYVDISTIDGDTANRIKEVRGRLLLNILHEGHGTVVCGFVSGIWLKCSIEPWRIGGLLICRQFTVEEVRT